MNYKIVFVTFAVAICNITNWAAVPQRTMTEKLLRTVGAKRTLGEREALISPDGAHTAWVDRALGGQTVFLDGKAVGTYARVRNPWSDMHYAAIIPGLVFSKKGGRLAYVVSSGKQVRMVVDGKLGKPYADLGMPKFSSDGKRVAYAARKGKKWFVVVDGREGKRYDGISSGLGFPVNFSPDGRKVVFTAHVGDKTMTVIDSYELPYASNLVFSRIGAHYAFESSDKGFSVIKDGRPIPGARLPFWLSPNGKRIAYCVVKPSITITIGDSSTSTGKRKRYEGKGNAYHLRLDGKLSKPCKTTMRNAAFSPNSKRFAYAAMPYKNRHDREVLVVDGRESKQMYGGISSITFSPDSKRLACCVTLNTRHRLLVDGRIMDVSGWPSSPVFSPDSRHIAYRIGIGQSGIGVDGKQIGKKGYDYWGTPVFSPDSKHVLSVARKDEKASVSIDGVPGPLYDDILESAIFFDAPNRFHYFALRGRNVYRVDEHI